jgi:hypothetical protein
MNEPTISHVARGILDYLRKHPEAQDTAAGISEWWLPKLKVKTLLKDVESALEELVAKELVLERTSRNSQTHYRMNVNKMSEIEALLDQ